MRFRYLLDPVFLMCVAVFMVNKCLLRPYLGDSAMGWFFQGYLNDCICIPLWVPVVITVMRIFRLRDHDLPPQGHEILLPLLVWSVVFEVVLPQTILFRGIAIADAGDVLSYVVGAVFAAYAWHWIYRPTHVSTVVDSSDETGRREDKSVDS